MVISYYKSYSNKVEMPLSNTSSRVDETSTEPVIILGKWADILKLSPYLVQQKDMTFLFEQTKLSGSIDSAGVAWPECKRY